MTTLFIRSLCVSALLCHAMAWADADRADLEPNDAPQSGDAVAWKLSLGRYQDAEAGYANDVNLRGSTGNLSFWVAQYRDASHYTQTRTGVEQQTGLPLGRLISSLQSASGGFVGGSVTWDLRQSDAQWFAPMVGWGRTNGQTYYNLNFDPNDSVLIGGTFVAPHDGMVTLYRIHDDRFHTGQTVTHAAYRFKAGAQTRWTVDVFRREGRSDADAPMYRGTGVSVAWDYQRYQLKFVRDPKANFSSADVNRVVMGLRF